MSRLLLSATLLLATPALADPTPAKPKPAKGSPEEVVCRRETVTGTLAGSKRMCMTRAQWQAQADEAQATAQRVDEQGRITTCTAAGGC